MGQVSLVVPNPLRININSETVQLLASSSSLFVVESRDFY